MMRDIEWIKAASRLVSACDRNLHAFHEEQVKLMRGSYEQPPSWMDRAVWDKFMTPAVRGAKLEAYRHMVRKAATDLEAFGLDASVYRDAVADKTP